MKAFVVEAVDRSDTDYRVEATDAETTVSVFCDAEKLKIVRDCIEITLSKNRITSCSLGKMQGFALSPHFRQERGSHRLIITTGDNLVSIPVEEQQLEGLIEASLDPLLERK